MACVKEAVLTILADPAAHGLPISPKPQGVVTAEPVRFLHLARAVTSYLYYLWPTTQWVHIGISRKAVAALAEDGLVTVSKSNGSNLVSLVPEQYQLHLTPAEKRQVAFEQAEWEREQREGSPHMGRHGKSPDHPTRRHGFYDELVAKAGPCRLGGTHSEPRKNGMVYCEHGLSAHSCKPCQGLPDPPVVCEWDGKKMSDHTEAEQMYCISRSIAKMSEPGTVYIARGAPNAGGT